MRAKHEGIAADDLFYVFVDIGAKPSQRTVCHILPSREVAKCLKMTHQASQESPGKGGKPHKDTAFRRLTPDYSHLKPISVPGKRTITKYRAGWLDPYREKWRILGLPGGDTF